MCRPVTNTYDFIRRYEMFKNYYYIICVLIECLSNAIKILLKQQVLICVAYVEFYTYLYMNQILFSKKSLTFSVVGSFLPTSL